MTVQKLKVYKSLREMSHLTETNITAKEYIKREVVERMIL